MGTVQIEVMATPGHSPDSICLCLFEPGVPVALFSGDTLFAGDVGRPDLRDLEVGTRELASMLYDSLFHKLLRLPPEVRVYPAHGAIQNPPGEWAQMRARWLRFHVIRTLFSVPRLPFMCLL